MAAPDPELVPVAPARLSSAQILARLHECGIRVTAQRRQIAELLLATAQHLSAEQVTEALARSGQHVAKATIYNTLNLFAAHGLIRQLSIDAARSWFDSNVQSHYHFHDQVSGELTDVALPEVQFSRLPAPPAGMEVAGIDMVIRLRPRG